MALMGSQFKFTRYALGAGPQEHNRHTRTPVHCLLVEAFPTRGHSLRVVPMVGQKFSECVLEVLNNCRVARASAHVKRLLIRLQFLVRPALLRRPNWQQCDQLFDAPNVLG